MENMELLKDMQEMMDANQENMLARLEAKIQDIKAKQAKTESAEEEMNAMMGRHQEKMDAG
jgi:hypothetical protein